MIKNTLILLSVFFFYGFIYCQEVDTISIYNVSFSQIGDVYSIDGKAVTESEYEHYYNQYIMAKECCPCVVKIYNGDTLVKEEKRCNGQIDDYFIWYYPDGKIESSGHYSPNNFKIKMYSIGNGDVYSKDGVWLSLDCNKDTTNIEIWDNGIFVSQSPAIDSSEIWGVKVTYRMKNIIKYSGQISTFKSFKFKPYYKTNDHDAKLKIGVVVMTDGITIWNADFSVKEFKELKMKVLADDYGLQIKDNTIIWLSFKSNGIIFGNNTFKIANTH